MNLQEDINRIHQMMGVINENNDSKIKKLIDLLGIEDAILYYGGYKSFKEQGGFSVLIRENIIDVIKSHVSDDSTRGTILSHHNGIEEVLFGIYDWGINVETYEEDTFITEKDILYDDVSDEMLEKILISVMRYK
jgi:hypothetical protein